MMCLRRAREAAVAEAASEKAWRLEADTWSRT